MAETPGILARTGGETIACMKSRFSQDDGSLVGMDLLLNKKVNG
jgi:hypothetical protein